MLQFIGSLIFGLLLASLTLRRKPKNADALSGTHWRYTTPLLFAALAGTALAFLLTVTRASQLAFMFSAALIVLLGAGKKWLIAIAVIGVPVALVGLLFLQQSRQVGFFDTNDDSIKWRQTVWREGLDLWTQSPRQLCRSASAWTRSNVTQRNGTSSTTAGCRSDIFTRRRCSCLSNAALPALLLWMFVLAAYADAMAAV